MNLSGINGFHIIGGMFAGSALTGAGVAATADGNDTLPAAIGGAGFPALAGLSIGALAGAESGHAVRGALMGGVIAGGIGLGLGAAAGALID
jgi:hypothetical protein